MLRSWQALGGPALGVFWEERLSGAAVVGFCKDLRSKVDGYEGPGRLWCQAGGLS